MAAILITGAAAGIGLATARSLVGAGRTVVGADRDEVALDRAAAALGAGFVPAPVDLVDAVATDALVAAVARERGLGAIVHSAGLFPQASLAGTSVEMWDRVMAINLRAAFVLARAGATAMPGGGALVFLTSGAGLMAAAADPFQRPFALYGASKAGLDRFAAGVAADLAESRIVVTTITPGAFVETPGTAQVDRAAAPDMARIDVARVGEAVAWLADAPRFAHVGARLAATHFGQDWGPQAP